MFCNWAVREIKFGQGLEDGELFEVVEGCDVLVVHEEYLGEGGDVGEFVDDILSEAVWL